MRKSPHDGGFSHVETRGISAPGTSVGWEGFGCQVHRPHVADDFRLWTRVGAGLHSSAERGPHLFGSGIERGRSGNPPGSRRPPVFNSSSVARGFTPVQGKSGNTAISRGETPRTTWLKRFNCPQRSARSRFTMANPDRIAHREHGVTIGLATPIPRPKTAGVTDPRGESPPAQVRFSKPLILCRGA